MNSITHGLSAPLTMDGLVLTAPTLTHAADVASWLELGR